jgi:hypothetical protein
MKGSALGALDEARMLQTRGWVGLPRRETHVTLRSDGFPGFPRSVVGRYDRGIGRI